VIASTTTDVVVATAATFVIAAAIAITVPLLRF
jgi:hypothetical protein